MHSNSFAFELDVRAAELRKHGYRIRLQEQPYRILLELLQNPGEIVLREEIRQKLWPDDTVVEFDKSINAAIKRLRDALNDSAEGSRYVETLPRRGYRFIGRVEPIALVQAATVSTSMTSLAGGELIRSVEFESLSSIPQSSIPQLHRTNPAHRLLAGSVLIFFLAALCLWWYWRSAAPTRWVEKTARSEISRLVGEGRYADAFPVLNRALQILPRDASLIRTRREISTPISIVTTPPGANVYVKPYGSPQGEWISIGESPVRRFALPTGYYRIRLTKAGYRTVEAAAGIFNPTFRFLMDRLVSAPPDMVHISSGEVRLFSAETVVLKDYWMDKYEVTNRAFKAFVAAGGYQKKAYWREPFVKEGRSLSWAESIQEFHDTTGRPGPSTWALGDYPTGEDDYPVSGVSWYEAMAYAAFAHKQIPTVYHWLRAADTAIWSDVLRFSNFASGRAIRVGSSPSIGPFGTYDLAGNAKEWTLNASGDNRYILGGAWNETTFRYMARDAMPSFDRSPANGFRCVRYDAAVLPPMAIEAITQINRDHRTEKPATETAFEIVRNFYTYDAAILRAVKEPAGERAPSWRMEKIQFDAAYRQQRVTAYLFLPKVGRPPYQTVIYGPPGSAYIAVNIDDAELQGFDFLMKTGRAVLVPVVQGTYGRKADPGSNNERDIVVEDIKDYRRALDYLETRTDIDRSRIAYLGYSSGSRLGMILMAIDKRIRVGALAEAGLSNEKKPLEVDELNFVSRVRVPILTMNGRNDFFHPVDTDQIPLHHLLGASERDKRHVLFEAGHVILNRNGVIKETLNWFDRYLGTSAR